MTRDLDFGIFWIYYAFFKLEFDSDSLFQSAHYSSFVFLTIFKLNQKQKSDLQTCNNPKKK